MRIKNITLGIPQRVCSHLTIRPIIDDIDSLSINTYIEVFDKVTTTTVNAQGETITNIEKIVCWTGNVPITEAQYALSVNNKTLLEDQVIAYLGLIRR
jgi:hypothetical protein